MLRGTPECFQQSLHLAFGVCVCVCRRRSLSFAGLPVVTPLFTYIYILSFCLHCSELVTTHVSLCVYARVKYVGSFLPLLSFDYSSVQRPHGPA